MTDQDLVNAGTRKAIRDNVWAYTADTVLSLSTAKELPNIRTTERRFGTVEDYTDQINSDLRTYHNLASELSKQGCDRQIVRAFCHNFEPTAEFATWLQAGRDVMIKLSPNTVESQQVLRLLKDGLNLLGPETYDKELEFYTSSTPYPRHSQPPRPTLYI